MKKVLYVSLLALAVLALVAPPAMAQEDKPFKVHGEVRFRGEQQQNASDLNSDTQDGGDFWPYRVRVAVEGSFARNVSAYIEIQNADIAGGSGTTRTGFGEDNGFIFGPAFGGGSNVELYQGNVTFNQLWSKNFSLRLGRQEIVAGNELLLGDLDFYAGLSHDGAVGTWNLRKVNLMLWFTRPLENNAFNVFGNTSPDNQTFTGNNGTQNFFGGYATWTFRKDQGFDVYLMDLDTKGTSNVQTVGVRWAHDQMSKAGFFWNVELAQQFGDANYAADSKAKGRAIEGWLGFNLKSRKNIHRFYGRYEMATGDDASSADFQGFIPMFGDFHNRTGHGDWFRLQDASTNLAGGLPAGNGGLKAFSVGYNGFYNDRHEFGAAYWLKYQLDTTTAGLSDDLGKAIDIWYGFNYSKNVNFTASLSQLNPGDALKAAAGGSDDAVMRLYGQARLRF